MKRALLIGVILALAAAAALLVIGRRSEREPVEPAERSPRASEETAPSIQQADEAALSAPPEAPSRPEPVAAESSLPALDDSDEVVTGALVEMIGRPGVERFVAQRDILRKAVVTVVNLSRARLPRRIRVVPPIEGRIRTTGEGDEVFLAPENYARYEEFVRYVGELDAAMAVEAYSRFYPLLQGAYQQLGLPDLEFNDVLIAAIDEILRAPKPEPPIHLVRHVLHYRFADPALENLPVGQKALIRMGPENAAIVEAKLREIRAELIRRVRT